MIDKRECQIVNDLLWQYSEGECSEGTKEFVGEHLKVCKECSSRLESLRAVEILPEPVPSDEQKADAVCKKSLKRLRKRLVLSLVIAMLAIVPMYLMGWLCVGQIRGEGVCFTNIDDIGRALSFAKCLANERFSAGAKMLDLEYSYDEIMEAKAYHDEIGGEDAEAFYKMYGSVLEMTREEYVSFAEDNFIRRMEAYSEMGYRLRVRGVGDVYKLDSNWYIEILLAEEKDGSREYFSIELCISSDTMRMSGARAGSYFTSEALGRIVYP